MNNNNTLLKAAMLATKVKPEEVKATLLSFILVFVLMAAYYILRPVRDAMASEWSDAEVSLLWTINFCFSFLVTAAYGLAATKITIKYLVPAIYVFFCATFLLFYVAAQYTVSTTLIDKAFYIWVSVFSLFPISVFWSYMADIFNQEQSKRLFGTITTGASLGAMLGPSIPLLFSNIGSYNLMLVASATLLLTLPIILVLQNIKTAQLDRAANKNYLQPLGGSSLAGFRLFLQSPFLLGIGLFLFLYTGIGSFVYFELKNLMVDFTREQRTEIWAWMDFATNCLTVVAGLLVTSRLATRYGLGLTLAILPLIVFGGLLSVAMVPLLPVVIGLQIVRRSGNYAITRPAREMLFTHVDQQTRFKAKQVIDVVVYRGGDVFWSWAFTGLTQGIGLGVAGAAIFGAAIASVWSVVALRLGHQADQDKYRHSR